jgi:methionyl-tRNA formyltransferase
MDKRPTIALAGSVSFSRTALQRLIQHRTRLVGVLGLSERRSRNVSDYARMDDLAAAAGIEHLDFDSINEESVLAIMRRWSPDVFFVVGLSQLVRADVMAVPRLGCVGFHPTRLPSGRGRAPVAWLTYFGLPGAATFFQIDEGVDSGPIFVQEPFEIAPDSYAEETVAKVNVAIERALDRWVPVLNAGNWNPLPQNDSTATYFGRRSREDGLIDWSLHAAEIVRLVRTASRPYPGAYTHYKGRRLTIWRGSVAEDARYRGVIGRILAQETNGTFLVQAGSGVVRVEETEFDEGPSATLSVGAKLGFSAQDEIESLRRKVAKLEEQIARMQSITSAPQD